MTTKSVDSLLNLLLDETADDERREEAAIALGALGEQALPSLRQLLQAPHSEHRWWAVRALAAWPPQPAESPPPATSGPSTAVSLLIERLEDPVSDVRACAALALGALGAPEAAVPLTHLLGEKSAFVQRIAGNALIQIGAPAVPALIETLNSPSPAARAGAARALIPLESHAAIPALFAALDDDSAFVTHYAEEALARMGVGMVYFKP
jgi:HEAT repeat protein